MNHSRKMKCISASWIQRIVFNVSLCNLLWLEIKSFKEVDGHACFSVSHCKMCSRMSYSVADTKSNFIFYSKSQNHCFLLSYLFGKFKMWLVCVRLCWDYPWVSTKFYGKSMHCLTWEVYDELTVSIIRCLNEKKWSWLVQLVVVFKDEPVI